MRKCKKRKVSIHLCYEYSLWCERRDLNPYGITTRPSNVRVCRFRHSRIPLGTFDSISPQSLKVKCFFDIFLSFFRFPEKRLRLTFFIMSASFLIIFLAEAIACLIVGNILFLKIIGIVIAPEIEYALETFVSFVGVNKNS